MHENGDIGCRNIYQLSDIQMKENIMNLRNVLPQVMKLRGAYFSWKDHSNEKDIGLIAQEVQPYFPELIFDSNGKKMLNYNGFIPILIEAIKEQQHQIEQQKSQIRKLQIRLDKK